MNCDMHLNQLTYLRQAVRCTLSPKFLPYLATRSEGTKRNYCSLLLFLGLMMMMMILSCLLLLLLMLYLISVLLLNHYV